jgi:hypothetical protein
MAMDKNGLMMRCVHCGEMNRLPVVHCRKCGAKLDFEAAEQRILNEGGMSLAERLRMVVKLGVAAGLAVTVLLAIWPGRMARTTGEAIDARRYRVKTELLIDSLNRGMPASQVVTEAEINAHLRELLAAQPPGSRWAGRLEDIGVRFIGSRAEAFVAVGRGPFTLTGHLVARVQGQRLVVVRARAGHLPLPGILGRLYAYTQSGLLRQLNNESRILRNLDGVSVRDTEAEILIRSDN